MAKHFAKHFPIHTIPRFLSSTELTNYIWTMLTQLKRHGVHFKSIALRG